MRPQGHGAAHSYLKTQVESSTPLERVAMLYTGAVAALTAAIEATAKRDLRARRTSMNRAMAIVAELQNTLDVARGGQIAADLDRLYTYVLTRMIEGVSKQDPAPLDEARSILGKLGEAWQQIACAPAAAPAAPPGPAR
jgi:flagellar protein FliS